jgi:hypothetical protein
MFEPIEIHGEGEYAENYTRVSYDEDLNAVDIEFFNEETGEQDGGTQSLSLNEVHGLALALFAAYMHGFLKRAGLD